MPRFSPISPDIMGVREIVAEQLADARARLEAPGTDPVRTESLRGQITALRWLDGLLERGEETP